MIIRFGSRSDLDFLETMLFEAFFWDPASVRPSFDDFRQHPEFVKLLAGWGRAGDRALVAECNGTPIAAAWYRLWTPDVHSYGFVDSATPELAIAVSPGHRRRGVGHSLLTALIACARAENVTALSLSVSPRNPVRRLYESLGFEKVGETGTSWTLRLRLPSGSQHSGW